MLCFGKGSIVVIVVVITVVWVLVRILVVCKVTEGVTGFVTLFVLLIILLLRFPSIIQISQQTALESVHRSVEDIAVQHNVKLVKYDCELP